MPDLIYKLVVELGAPGIVGFLFGWWCARQGLIPASGRPPDPRTAESEPGASPLSSYEHIPKSKKPLHYNRLLSLGIGTVLLLSALTWTYYWFFNESQENPDVPAPTGPLDPELRSGRVFWAIFDGPKCLKDWDARISCGDAYRIHYDEATDKWVTDGTYASEDTPDDQFRVFDTSFQIQDGGEFHDSGNVAGHFYIPPHKLR